MDLTSKDPQVVTYTLNPAAVWEDGTPIGLEDFQTTWSTQNGKTLGTTLDDSGNPLPLYDAASTTGYEDITSVDAGTDPNTIAVTFSKPYADYLALFSPLVHKAAFEAAGGGDLAVGFNTGYQVANLKLDTVVSGAQYDVSDYKAGQSMTLVRNEKYYGTPGLLDSIVVPFITDGSQQPAALENGEVDVIFPQAQLDLVNQTKGIPDVTSFVGFGTFWEHLDLNQSNADLAKLPVRQAIAKALDRQAIVTALPAQFDDKATVLNNRMYFPASPNYVDNGSADYGAADDAAAKALLEGAGYTAGADGMYLTLRLTWRDPNPRRQATAQLIQDQLKSAGIGITFAPQPDFAFLASGDFDIALFGWTGGTVLSSNASIYVTGGGQNYTKNTDADIDSLFDQANVELDPAKRADLMNQIDVKIWADVATIPLFQVPEFLAWKNTVQAVEYNGYQGPTWNSQVWALAQ